MIAKRNIYSFLILLLIFSQVFFSCNWQSQTSKINSPDDILNADIAFSDMCREIGMKKAFLQYIDNEGVLLRPDHLPIIGADAIDYISILSDTAYKLSWRPMHAVIAKSGDIGYSYGTYQLKINDTTLTGTYVNIWKKESDGEWKFVLNSNNPGLSHEP